MHSSIPSHSLSFPSILLTTQTAQSTLPLTKQPNHKLTHASKKFSRSDYKHNPNHAQAPPGEKFSKRTGEAGGGGNEMALKNAGGLQNSLAFLICILSDEIMASEMKMGMFCFFFLLFFSLSFLYLYIYFLSLPY